MSQATSRSAPRRSLLPGKRRRHLRSVRSDEVPAELYEELASDAEALGIAQDESTIVVTALRLLHERAGDRRLSAELRESRDEQVTSGDGPKRD